MIEPRRERQPYDTQQIFNGSTALQELFGAAYEGAGNFNSIELTAEWTGITGAPVNARLEVNTISPKGRAIKLAEIALTPGTDLCAAAVIHGTIVAVNYVCDTYPAAGFLSLTAVYK